MAKTITAANSVYLLTIPGLYSTAQLLQGYATDDAFATEAVDTAEVVKGVDGNMSAGFVPYLTKQTLMLQADSNSQEIFENWLAAMLEAREVLYANATLSIPSLERKYAMIKGVLTNVQATPSAKKTMQPRPWIITWDRIDPAPGN